MKTAEAEFRDVKSLGAGQFEKTDIEACPFSPHHPRIRRRAPVLDLPNRTQLRPILPGLREEIATSSSRELRSEVSEYLVCWYCLDEALV